MSILHFFKYHNAVPIALGILFMGSGITFAATNPETIYSASQRVVSIDNTYIVGKDLSAYSPRVQITAVTEDEGNYYIAYDFMTIDLVDSVWLDTTKHPTMTVSKEQLGAYRDLGLYVTEQLKQNVDAELVRLKNTQDIERKSVSQKVVATVYGGLIGRMLDTSTETLPGYTPVITPPPRTEVASAASASGETSTESQSDQNSGISDKIGLQLLGNNPAIIPLRALYTDLGAVLIDPYNTNAGVHVFQDGREVTVPTIDTSASSVRTIEYRATDPNGSTIMVRRVVLVGGAADPGGEISTAGAATTSAPPTPTPAPAPAPASTPAPTPAPTPTPEPTPTPAPTPEATSTSTSTSTTTPAATTDTPPPSDATSTPTSTSTDATTTPPVDTTTPLDTQSDLTGQATTATATTDTPPDTTASSSDSSTTATSTTP